MGVGLVACLIPHSNAGKAFPVSKEEYEKAQRKYEGWITSGKRYDRFSFNCSVAVAQSCIAAGILADPLPKDFFGYIPHIKVSHLAELLGGTVIHGTITSGRLGSEIMKVTKDFNGDGIDDTVSFGRKTYEDDE